MRAPLRSLAGLCLLSWLLSGCDARRVNACDDSRTSSLTCIDLQLDGQLGDLSQLYLTFIGGPDNWSGYGDIQPGSAFQLPVAVAVALPPFVHGTVHVQVQALLDRQQISQAAVDVPNLQKGEHREVDLTLQRMNTADLGGSPQPVLDMSRPGG